MNIENLSQRLLDITKEKCGFLKEVYRLTSKQSEAISNKDLTEFLAMSTQKQELIEKANILDEEFEKQYDLLKKSTDANAFIEVFSNQKALKELQSVIIQISNVMESIKTLELKNKDSYKTILLDMMVAVNQSAVNRTEQISRYKKMNEYKKNKS